MYDALARSVLFEEDPERVARDVAEMRERNPRLSREEISQKLIRRAAIRAAAVGALASAPAGWMPGLPAAADFPYQVLAMNRLARSVALALRRPTSGVERAAAAVASLAAVGTAGWLRGRAIARARRFLGPRAPRLSPFAGALIGAALSAAVTAALGKAAHDYCRSTPPPRALGR